MSLGARWIQPDQSSVTCNFYYASARDELYCALSAEAAGLSDDSKVILSFVLSE